MTWLEHALALVQHVLSFMEVHAHAHTVSPFVSFFVGKVGASTQKNTQKAQTSVDNTTAQRMGDLWNAGGAAAAAGPSAQTDAAHDYAGGLLDSGATGAAALGGDAAATAKLMNPYQQQVINANNAQWQKTNTQTENQQNDVATRAGAFGGSRHGVATGVALANNNMAQQQQTAGLLQQGYSGAMQQAGQAANLGLAGAQFNGNVETPEAYALRMKQQGYAGPTGQTSSGASSSTSGSLGLALPFLGGGK